jgi:hypothetical protein
MQMRIVWVVVLSIVALLVGAFGGLVYSGATEGIASVRVGCAVLDTAEKSGFLDRAQRADVVDRVGQMFKDAQRGPNDKTMEFVEQFKTGCPL